MKFEKLASGLLMYNVITRTEFSGLWQIFYRHKYLAECFMHILWYICLSLEKVIKPYQPWSLLHALF